jgi:hypothetical protein
MTAGRPRLEQPPLSPMEISDVLASVEQAQVQVRSLLARWLRCQGYADITLAAPKGHVLERLTAALEAENDLLKTVLGRDLRQAMHRRDYQKEFHRKRRAEARQQLQGEVAYEA